MKKGAKVLSAIIISTAVTLSGCANSPKIVKDNPSTIMESSTAKTTEPQKQDTSNNPGTVNNNTGSNQPDIDLSKVKPNEAGKVMVVMFHNFIEAYKSGDKEYTTTFDEFGQLLQTLYDKGYRLISMSDYISNNINVPAGCIPMVFTFDDGTAGQFNLIDESGKLAVNPKSAVGVMEEFNKKHPDFGLKGTFYVNLGGGTFAGKGTLQERLKYLIDKGFEIGNHTLNHIDLKHVKSADEVMKEVGGNQKAMEELVPGYVLKSLALPLGHTAKENLRGYVAKGEYQGVKYENSAIMLVGANPAPSPVSSKFNPLSTPRVRAAGIKKVDADLAWWLEKISLNEQYISDGNPNTVTVPKSKEGVVDKNRLNGKNLVIY